MKKINLLLIAFFVSIFVCAQTVSDFENLTLPTDSFWNGSDLSGGFASGNAFFRNDYDTTFYSWSGFTYSNMRDSSTPGYMNQYSAITAGGYQSSNYAVADEYGNAKIILNGNAAGKLVKGFYITNTTYAYLSMLNGDAFAKKFGGASGNDADWFLLKAMAWLNGAMKQQSVEFYLADFRSADNTQDYIVKDWTWLDLQALGDADSIVFQLSSSDTSFGYMNTPAYFALDNFTTANENYVSPVAFTDYVTTNYFSDTLIDVLANDSGLVALPFTVQLIGNPLIPGAIDTVIDNKIYYTPAIGLVATDTLLYRLCDAAGQCDTAQVVINVISINSTYDIAGISIAVYPNPTNSDLTVNSNGEMYGVYVYNTSGDLVRSVNLNGQSSVTIGAAELPSGVYYLKIVDAFSANTMKVVKQ